MLLVGFAAVLAAAAVGWLLAGPAVRPLAALEQLSRADLTDTSTFGPVDVSDLVLRAAADAERTHPDLTVASDVPEGDVVVTGWEAGLRLAVDNLLTNAVRHARSARVDVAVRSAGAGVQVVVDDDGPGIPAAERDRVVGRFARGRDAAPGGSGLGLALVQQQALLHGGRLTLTDSPRGGLRAVLELGGAPPPGP